MDEKIRSFVRYWESLWPDKGTLPCRRHIDPCAIPDLLPGVALIDVIKGQGSTLRFRFRLAGSLHHDMNRMELTGRMFEDVFEAHDLPEIVAVYTAVVTTWEPHYWHRRSAVRGREFVSYERVLLPMAEDGRTVDTLAGMWVWLPLDRTLVESVFPYRPSPSP